MAAEFLKKRSDLYYDRYTKEPDSVDGVYQRQHAVSLLEDAFFRIAERNAEIAEQPEEKLFYKIENERYYTVDEKIFSLMRLLVRHERCPFEDAFSEVKSRGELVAVFLAVLETVRKGRVDVIKEKKQLFLILVRNNEDKPRE